MSWRQWAVWAVLVVVFSAMIVGAEAQDRPTVPLPTLYGIVDHHLERQNELLERQVRAEERQAAAMEDLAREVTRIRSGR